MVGRIESIAGDRVTIGGVTYSFRDGVRWVLERALRDGCEVEFVTDSTRSLVREVTVVPCGSNTGAS